MKKLILFFCFVVSKSVFACDFCGCFMGITPYDKQSNITVLYRYKSFNGYSFTGQQNNLFPQGYKTQHKSINTTPHRQLKHGGEHHAPTPQYSQKNYEVYTTAELRAKYFIHQRLELNAIIPFIMNSSYNTIGETESIQGIGDLTFFAGYHLISKTMTEKFQHRLILGGGIKLPTGNYNAKNNDEERIDFLLQPGTGSIDYMGYVNYIFGYKKMGFNFNSTYKLNGQNYYHEHIGNSATNYITFYKFRQDKNFKIIPSIQGYYEYSKGEYINDVYQTETEMNNVTAGVGLDLFYKRFSLSTAFHMPVYEKRFENNLSMAGKFMIGLTYNFNQKKYLLKSKKVS